MGTADLRVYSIEAWAKYTGAANYAQHLHRDYLGASLLVPSSDLQFGQVEVFLYLCDVPVELGPPAFVALRHAADLPMIPNWFPPEDGGRDLDQPTWISPAGRSDLYEHEVRAAGPLGTVAAYTNRTFHRGHATDRARRRSLHPSHQLPTRRERMAEPALMARTRQHARLVGLPRAGLPTPTRPLRLATTRPPLLDNRYHRVCAATLSRYRCRPMAHRTPPYGPGWTSGMTGYKDVQLGAEPPPVRGVRRRDQVHGQP